MLRSKLCRVGFSAWNGIWGRSKGTISNKPEAIRQAAAQTLSQMCTSTSTKRMLANMTQSGSFRMNWCSTRGCRNERYCPH